MRESFLLRYAPRVMLRVEGEAYIYVPERVYGFNEAEIIANRAPSCKANLRSARFAVFLENYG